MIPAFFLLLTQQAASQVVETTLSETSSVVWADVAQSGDTLVPTVFEGVVLEPDGTPAEGAVVVSSAGGKAVTDGNGSFRLEAQVPLDAASVQVTAIGRGGNSPLASSSVLLAAASGPVLVGPLLLSQGTSCSPSWLPTFCQPGTDLIVSALAVFDDGGGPALYAGGYFETAGCVAANHVAKWDGSSWSALGYGLNDVVNALAVFDDGSGPALYAGGAFVTTEDDAPVSHIAKWNGSFWVSINSFGGNGVNNDVYALAVFDNGGGPALYAGGLFTTAGGVSTNRIAKWNGSLWSALGSGMNNAVTALAVFDNGGGSALYAGGAFTTAGGVSANCIAKWSGSSWSALGSGMSGAFPSVYALAVFDNGGGPALYVGGNFTTPASRIAKWNGSSWSALGTGMNGDVNTLAVFNDGGGNALYAGGLFTTAGGVSASRMAKWNGSSWSSLGTGMNADVMALSVFDDGAGPALYAGGFFTTAGGVAATWSAKWDGSSWGPLGSGMNGEVVALSVFDDGLGGGQALYAAGSFTGLGSESANRIAKWDGSSWSALGSGMNNDVVALAVFDDGGGPALYAGGTFTTAGGVPANRIAKWNGSSWSALGGGLSGIVRALAIFDDGGGSALYAGGFFLTAGGAAANRIARWDGSSWSALGSGVTDSVHALAVFDDGGGPALFAGGYFTSAGGVAADRVAKWDGSSWSALGSGMNDGVWALAPFDDGGGPALYAGGYFTTAGGASANLIAKWDGSSWSALGSGMDSSPTNFVRALSVFANGGGPTLYAGGTFTTAGGVAASRIAMWDGSSWSALGSGMNERVDCLSVFDDGGGPALYAGGLFTSAYDSGDTYLAKWYREPDTTPPVLSCPVPPWVWKGDPRGTTPGEFVFFTVPATDCVDPSPAVVCVPPSGSFFPRGVTRVTCTATDASGNESTCYFDVIVERTLRPR
ncbi:MAG: HYR domain-containing protein [Planctomycetes bacterium]|nr:HYR domain-containing protein [Planctomycetota bacterium]